MSRLLHKRLAVALFPGCIAWALSRRGLRARVAGSGAVRTAPPEASGWQPVMAALGPLLGEHGTPGMELKVVVSGRFTQCLLLDWPENVEEDEASAYAAHHFRRVFGDGAERWSVHVEDPGSGPRRLACAVDAELIAALRAAASVARMRLVSVEPLLVSAVNQCRRAIGAESTVVLVAEPGRYYSAALRAGEWQSLRQGRLLEDSAAELGEVLTREAVLCDSDKAQLLLFAPAHREPEALGEAASRLRRAPQGGAGLDAFVLGALA